MTNFRNINSFLRKSPQNIVRIRVEDGEENEDLATAPASKLGSLCNLQPATCNLALHVGANA